MAVPCVAFYEEGAKALSTYSVLSYLSGKKGYLPIGIGPLMLLQSP
jgi:hypothetical protein